MVFFMKTWKNVFWESVFRIWSPFAEEVMIRFYRDGSEGDAFAVYEMKRLEKGVWEYRAKEDFHGIYYDFALRIDGEVVISTDICAKACGINGKAQYGGGPSPDGPGWLGQGWSAGERDGAGDL